MLIEGIPFGVRSRSCWWLRAPVADSCYSVYSGQLPWSMSVTELGLNGQVCGFVLARRAPVRTFYTSNGGLLRDSSVITQQSGTLVFRWCTGVDLAASGSFRLVLESG